MAEEYFVAGFCMPWPTATQCIYDGEHVVDYRPGRMPDRAEVRLNAALDGYGVALFTFDNAFVNGKAVTGAKGASLPADIGSWGIDIDVDNSIEDGTAYAISDSAIFYWWKDAEIPDRQGGTWSGSGNVNLANVRWKGASSVTVTTEMGMESTLSIRPEAGISNTITLSNGRSITTEISYEMWPFSALESTPADISGNWSFGTAVGCWVCNDILRDDDLHEHYTTCYGCLEIYPCSKNPPSKHKYGPFPCGDDTHIGYACDTSEVAKHKLNASCTTHVNGDSCKITAFYPCQAHSHKYTCGYNYSFNTAGCGNSYTEAQKASHAIVFCDYCLDYYKACHTTCGSSESGHSFSQ